MRKFLKDKKTLKTCRIFSMLSTHARGKHLSFHTPGHKVGRWDITELSFSDNLASPTGCIALAEREIFPPVCGACAVLQMHGTDAIVVLFHKCERVVVVGGDVMADIEVDHELR